MTDEIKRIDIKEFRELGYLQELNRQFLHPLGMALEVVVDDETGEEKLGGVWDSREDPEGFRYLGFPKDVMEEIRLKFEFVTTEQSRMNLSRFEALGYTVQPIEDFTRKVPE